MNKARVLPRVAFWSVAALTLAAVCLRTAAFLTGYDGDIGYFRSAAVTVVYRVLCLFVVLIPAVCGMLIRRAVCPPRASAPGVTCLPLFR